jgi:hypothetical protein
MYEREIRQTLNKLERVVSFIPEPAQQKKTSEDLDRLSDQFSALVFAENPTSEEESTKQEKDMKKLLTITKSKFYMLRVNFPKAFEVSVDRDNHLSHTSEEQHDPLADKIPAVANNL